MPNSVHCGFCWLLLRVACVFLSMVIILIVILCSVVLYLLDSYKAVECPSTKDLLLPGTLMCYQPGVNLN